MYNYLARVMKNLRYVLLTALAMVTTMIASAQVTFLGNGREIYEETPAANTGLNHIYVLYDTQGVSMVYNAGTDPDDVTWLRFGEQGGAYATEVEGIVRSGNITTLPQVEANCGYIIEEGHLLQLALALDIVQHEFVGLVEDGIAEVFTSKISLLQHLVHHVGMPKTHFGKRLLWKKPRSRSSLPWLCLHPIATPLLL